MSAVCVTVLIDEETKREFDSFCENVGMNITTAFNLFIKATLRSRVLPFNITDIEPLKNPKETTMLRGLKALKDAQEQVKSQGLSDMSPDEINMIIEKVRQEKQGQR